MSKQYPRIRAGIDHYVQGMNRVYVTRAYDELLGRYKNINKKIISQHLRKQGWEKINSEEYIRPVD